MMWLIWYNQPGTLNCCCVGWPPYRASIESLVDFGPSLEDDDALSSNKLVSILPLGIWKINHHTSLVMRKPAFCYISKAIDLKLERSPYQRDLVLFCMIYCFMSM